MFASYLIGLREGLEVMLVVSVLVAYLVKSGRRALPPVWTGVGAAVALAVGFGWLLTYHGGSTSATGQELFDAITSVVAVVLVTWMIFWMRRTARAALRRAARPLDGALGMGSLAVVGIAFLAVVREGLETALLFFASAQGADHRRAAGRARAGLAHRRSAIGWAALRRRRADQPHASSSPSAACC